MSETPTHAVVEIGDRTFEVAHTDIDISMELETDHNGRTISEEHATVEIDGHAIETTDETASPSDPEWAGSTVEVGDEQLWLFVRDGRVHLHDAESGELKHIEPVDAIPTHQLEALAEEWEWGPAQEAGQEGHTEISDAIHTRAMELRGLIEAHRDADVGPNDE